MPAEGCSDGFARQATEVNTQNMKGLLDSWQAIIQQGVIDNQKHARVIDALVYRMAKNAETMDHWDDMLGVPAGQTGTTEQQQTVSPGRTGAPEAAIDAEATSNAAIAASIGKLSEALVPIIEAAGGVVTAQTLAALLPVVVNAVGGASTPSQTQPKPTA